MSSGNGPGMRLIPSMNMHHRLSQSQIISPPLASTRESMMEHAVQSNRVFQPLPELLEALKALVNSENSSNPLTDESLAKSLAESCSAGEPFSAREVASMRRHLNIPPSRERKEL